MKLKVYLLFQMEASVSQKSVECAFLDFLGSFSCGLNFFADSTDKFMFHIIVWKVILEDAREMIYPVAIVATYDITSTVAF